MENKFNNPARFTPYSYVEDGEAYFAYCDMENYREGEFVRFEDYEKPLEELTKLSKLTKLTKLSNTKPRSK